MSTTRCRCERLARAVPLAWSITLLAAGCSARDSAPPDVTRPVKTMTVAAGEETHVRTFPGKVEASKKAELAFQVSGLLVDFPVKEGQEVAKGALIAQLRPDTFEANLLALKNELKKAQALLSALRSGERPEERLRLEANVRANEAKFANAQTEFNRSLKLFQAKAMARADYDLAVTAYRVAHEDLEAARRMLEQGTIAREEDIQAKEATVRALEARVVEAKIRLDDTTLWAPYDGVIAKRFVEPNEDIKAKQPVVRFQNVDEIVVAVDVPETVMTTDLRSADVVQMVAEFSGAPGIPYPVHITEVAQAADPVTQTFRVRAAMKAPPDVNLLPGMTATVTMTFRRAAVLGGPILVPISAVFKDGTGQQVAWVVGPDLSVARRAVKVGAATGSRIEILDGLQPGDRIAVAGAPFLREGMKVRDLGDALGGG
jgi:RND family efflux transporter MFP subunit